MSERTAASLRARGMLGTALRGALVLILCALAAVTLGFIAPVVVPIGLLVVLTVLLDPGGLGTKLRSSPGWWGFPGLRWGSHDALPFASLVACYTVLLPALAFTGLHLIPTGPGPLATVPGQQGSSATAQPGSAAPSESAASGSGTTRSPQPGTQPPSTRHPATPRGRSTSPSAAPTPTPGASPSPTASPTATSSPTPSPTATPSPDLCGAPANPWGYNLCHGLKITSAPAAFCSFFTCVAQFWSGSGYIVECSSGDYSWDRMPGNLHQNCGQIVQPLYKPMNG